MKVLNVLKKIDDLNEKYLKIWEDVVNIESPTSFKGGVDAVGSYFLDTAKLHGWQTEILKQKMTFFQKQM